MRWSLALEKVCIFLLSKLQQQFLNISKINLKFWKILADLVMISVIEKKIKVMILKKCTLTRLFEMIVKILINNQNMEIVTELK